MVIIIIKKDLDCGGWMLVVVAVVVVVVVVFKSPPASQCRASGGWRTSTKRAFHLVDMNVTCTICGWVNANGNRPADTLHYYTPLVVVQFGLNISPLGKFNYNQ